MSAHDTSRTVTGLDGILVVAKPAGPTSHDVVSLVRRLAATRRIGHGGTLDPFATGVLVLFLGTAVRLVEYHLQDPKAYRATVCFGASSTTDDLDGELMPVDGPGPTRSEVEAALEQFVGSRQQVPPAFSAVKVAGRRSYALARTGQQPKLEPRTVTTDRLEIVDWDDRDPARPIAVVEIACSAGFYVRALARDLGLALGNAAYLAALVRTGSGAFSLSEAVSLETIRLAAADGPAGMAAMLRPIDAGLVGFERVELTDDEVVAIVRGQFVRPAAGLSGVGPGETTDRRFLATDRVGRIVAVAGVRDGRLAPDKVLATTGLPSPRGEQAALTDLPAEAAVVQAEE